MYNYGPTSLQIDCCLHAVTNVRVCIAVNKLLSLRAILHYVPTKNYRDKHRIGNPRIFPRFRPVRLLAQASRFEVAFGAIN